MNHLEYGIQSDFEGRFKEAGSLLLLFVLGCGSMLPIPAQARLVPLSEAIETALGRNPDIRSLENQLSSAQARARQALSPAEPSFSIGFNDMTQPFRIHDTAGTSYTLVQPLGFPGKAFVSRSILSEQSEAISSQLKSKRLDVANSVKAAYYQLSLARRNIELNGDQKATYQRILEIAKRRYEAGSITQVDLLNSQLALYATGNELNDLKAAETAAMAQLNVLLGESVEARVETEPLSRAARPLVEKKEAQEAMIRNRPEIQAASHQATAAERAYRSAWMSWLPDFQLSAGTTLYYVPGASPVSQSNHTYLAGIQMTLPLWFLVNEREGIVAASHDRASSEANLDSVIDQSRIAFETAYEGLITQRGKIETYENHLLPLSEQSLNLALISYSSGKIDFQTLADTAAARRNIKRDYYALLVNYLSSYSVFGQLIGEDLR